MSEVNEEAHVQGSLSVMAVVTFVYPNVDYFAAKRANSSFAKQAPDVHFTFKPDCVRDCVPSEACQVFLTVCSIYSSTAAFYSPKHPCICRLAIS